MASSQLAKRDGGRREAAIIQTRVNGREASLSGQEVGVPSQKNGRVKKKIHFPFTMVEGVTA